MFILDHLTFSTPPPCAEHSKLMSKKIERAKSRPHFLIPLEALPLINSAPYTGFLNPDASGKTTFQVVSILKG